MSQYPQYVTAVSTQLSNVPQLLSSELKGCVNYQANFGESGEAFYLDDRGKTNPREHDTKGGRIEPKELDGERRGGYFRGDDDWFYVYEEDKMRMLLDPTNTDMQSLIGGRERKIDWDIVNNLLFGTSYKSSGSGQNAPLDTAESFPAGQVIADDDRQNLHDEEKARVAASGPLHLTVGKLITAKMMLQRSRVKGKLFIAVDEHAIGNLLASIPSTSADYRDAKSLADGNVDHFMGFTFKTFSSTEDDIIPTYTATGSKAANQYAAWIDNAVYYKERPVTNISVAKDTGIRGHPIQVYYKRERAWCRRYPKGVVMIKCTQDRQLAA